MNSNSTIGTVRLVLHPAITLWKMRKLITLMKSIRKWSSKTNILIAGLHEGRTGNRLAFPKSAQYFHCRRKIGEDTKINNK